MKKLLILFLLVFTGIFQPLLAQQETNQLLIQEYIKQSEKQKKTGLIMLGAGLGATLIGTVMIGAAWGNGSEFVGGAGAVLLVAGSISTLVSIPILVSSASNGRKAGRLSLGVGEVQALNPSVNFKNPYPALNFSLPLNSQKP